MFPLLPINYLNSKIFPISSVFSTDCDLPATYCSRHKYQLILKQTEKEKSESLTDEQRKHRAEQLGRIEALRSQFLPEQS